MGCFLAHICGIDGSNDVVSFANDGSVLMFNAVLAVDKIGLLLTTDLTDLGAIEYNVFTDFNGSRGGTAPLLKTLANKVFL